MWTISRYPFLNRLLNTLKSYYLSLWTMPANLFQRTTKAEKGVARSLHNSFVPAMQTIVIANFCASSFYSFWELRVHTDRHSRLMTSLILIKDIHTLCGQPRLFMPVRFGVGFKNMFFYEDLNLKSIARVSYFYTFYFFQSIQTLPWNKVTPRWSSRVPITCRKTVQSHVWDSFQL